MTLHRPAQTLSIARLLGKPSFDDSHPLPDVTPPMDETLLASELARLMERRAAPATRAKAVEPKRWLGDDADRAVVEHFVETSKVKIATDSAASSRDEPSCEAGSGDDLTPDATASATAGWVREARLQRRRTRLRDAGGWTVSIAITALIIVAASLAMVGWHQIEATLRQVLAPTVGVAQTSPDPASRPAAGTAAGAAIPPS